MAPLVAPSIAPRGDSRVPESRSVHSQRKEQGKWDISGYVLVNLSIINLLKQLCTWCVWRHTLSSFSTDYRLVHRTPIIAIFRWLDCFSVAWFINADVRWTKFRLFACRKVRIRSRCYQLRPRSLNSSATHPTMCTKAHRIASERKQRS